MPHPVIAFLAPGGGELIVVMLALLLLFGPKDAPRLLRKILDMLRKLQRSAADFKTQMLACDLSASPPPKPREAPPPPAPEAPPPPPLDPPPASGPAP